jgi:hypothetical protein
MLQRLAGWLLSLLVPVEVGWLLRFALLLLLLAACFLQQQNNNYYYYKKTATVAKWVVAKRQEVCIFFLSFSFLFPLSLSLSLSLATTVAAGWLLLPVSFLLGR